MADLAIAAFVIAGALIGFSRGFIVPVVATGGGLLATAAIYAGPLNGALPSGAVGLGVGALAMGLGATVFARIGGTAIALVHRFGFLKRVDRVLGAPLGAATAAVALYVGLLGTLVLDGWLGPLHGKAEIGPQEIEALQSLAAANPTFAVFANRAALKALAESAAKAPVAADQLEKLDSALGFYEKTVRPELLQSHIAPLLLILGEKIPVIGRPAALPTS